jgi:mRNA interferase RelE/StbE
VAYRVEFSRRAERQFKALSREIQLRLTARIDALAVEPRPPGTEKLSGPDDLYRVRVGDFRVVYAVQDAILLILVVRVGHWREVYRDLFR